MKRNLWPKWIKVKYIILATLYLCLLLHTIIRQCSTYRIRMDTSDTNQLKNEFVNVTELTIQIINSMFNVGYTIGHVPGGVLSDMYGGKYFLTSGLLLTSIVAVVQPYGVIYLHWFFTCVMEFTIGFCEGFIVPAAYSIIARWVPDKRLTCIAGNLETSFYFGRLVLLYMVFYFATSDDVWRPSLTSWGGIGVVLYFIALIFVNSSPFHSKMATQKDKNVMEPLVGNWMCCLALLAKSHIVISGETVAVVFRSSAFFLKGIHYASGQVNVLDLTRFYCGTVIGMQNAIGGAAGYIIRVGGTATKKDASDLVDAPWERLYDVTFSMSVMTTLTYFIWGRAERADWDVIVEDEEDEEEEFID